MKKDRPHTTYRWPYNLLCALAASILILYLYCSQFHSQLAPTSAQSQTCSVADYVRPKSYNADNSSVSEVVFGESFRKQSAAKLSGAIRIRTDVGDDAPLVEEDPEYWRAKFEPFHQYLEKTFPKAWEFCQVEKVNSWGLLLTWTGSDPSLKPIVLSAHQDVVPIQEATIDQWTHPPFDGVYDGDIIWGRGSADCKNLVVALLEVLEQLHHDGLKPKRTIVLAFGFDEEIGGNRGASYIAKSLRQRYGENGLYAFIDEGGQSLVSSQGLSMALVGTAEKGLLNYEVTVETPGGHSAVPPDHTSIGIMSELITRFEKQPFSPVFSPRNPTFYQYQCIAKFSNQIPSQVRHWIKSSPKNPKSREKVADYIYNSDLGSRYLVTTSQAVDVIHGGSKSNALPESVKAMVNHRIGVESSTSDVLQRNRDLVFGVARDFNLGLIENGQEVKPDTGAGSISVGQSWVLEPSPLTPVFDEKWNILSGSIRHVYEEVCKGTMQEFNNSTIIVTPGMAAGNTDTRHYWGLTPHIYRYRPGIVPTVETHAHGVNERLYFDSHLQVVAFYYEYLQVVCFE